MSTTFKVSDGQVDFDPSTGQLVLLEGERKASQDLAQCLLQNYNEEQRYGSLLNRLVFNQIPDAGEVLVRHYIAEAVRLLDQKQNEDPYVTSTEKISKITKLLTISLGNGALGYYVAVDTEGGSEVTNAAVKPTSLNHLLEGTS